MLGVSTSHVVILLVYELFLLCKRLLPSRDIVAVNVLTEAGLPQQEEIFQEWSHLTFSCRAAQVLRKKILIIYKLCGNFIYKRYINICIKDAGTYFFSFRKRCIWALGNGEGQQTLSLRSNANVLNHYTKCPGKRDIILSRVHLATVTFSLFLNLQILENRNSAKYCCK